MLLKPLIGTVVFVVQWVATYIIRAIGSIKQTSWPPDKNVFAKGYWQSLNFAANFKSVLFFCDYFITKYVK